MTTGIPTRHHLLHIKPPPNLITSTFIVPQTTTYDKKQSLLCCQTRIAGEAHGESV
ncbi:hypothetical protein I352_01385 [Cryptococcus deuterogattii MMRL2647]|nr:hypothetical protein I352_01385 [Cryptococcus deuterogattii MMRL2647]